MNRLSLPRLRLAGPLILSLTLMLTIGSGRGAAQVVNTGTLFITQDQVVFVDDDFVQADASNTTTNEGTLLLTGTLRFIDGVISEAGGALTGGWQQEPDPIEVRPDFHTVFLNSNAVALNPSAQQDGGPVDSLIDGPVRRRGSGGFVFPTGDVQDGQTHRGLLRMSGQAGPSDLDAHYFWSNGLADFGDEMASPLVAVSDKEYWRAWGEHAVTLAPFYETSSAIAPLLEGVPGAGLANLTLAGWDGSAWIDLEGTAALEASDQAGSVAARVPAPRTYSVVTFAVRLLDGADSDGDGVPDAKEWDANGDGQGPDDTDGDGRPDILDTDDDGDGFLTRDEDWDGSGDPCDDDSNGDGVPDYLDPNTPQARLLWVSKSVDHSRVEAGEALVWTLEVENRSDVPVVASVMDVLPLGLALDRDRLAETSGGQVGAPDGVTLHPQFDGRGLLLHWPRVRLAPLETFSVSFRTEATIGLDSGVITNHAFAVGGTGSAQFHSNLAAAEVFVGGNGQLDCSTVIGRVFKDLNANGYPDAGEPGLPGARLGEHSGLSIRVDEYGRFHLPCAMAAGKTGANIVLKLDETTLPTGFHLTSENPRVVRLTRGKVAKANFGASLGREVGLRLNDCAFRVPLAKARGLTPIWQDRLSALISVLEQHPATLVISYTVGPNVPDPVVQQRIAAVEASVQRLWRQKSRIYRLETVVQLQRQLGGKAMNCDNHLDQQAALRRRSGRRP